MGILDLRPDLPSIAVRVDCCVKMFAWLSAGHASFLIAFSVRKLRRTRRLTVADECRTLTINKLI
eukprot:1159398-Pelagomonas_calceolata.AAC.2